MNRTLKANWIGDSSKMRRCNRRMLKLINIEMLHWGSRVSSLEVCNWKSNFAVCGVRVSVRGALGKRVNWGYHFGCQYEVGIIFLNLWYGRDRNNGRIGRGIIFWAMLMVVINVRCPFPVALIGYYIDIMIFCWLLWCFYFIGSLLSVGDTLFYHLQELESLRMLWSPRYL